VADHISDERPHISFPSQVASKKSSGAAGRGQLCFDRGTLFRVSPDKRYGSTFCYKFLNNAAPDSRITAGNKGYFAAKPH
jgi:hypothetical protein